MTISNYITIFRIILVPVFFVFLTDSNDVGQHSKIIALIIFLIATVTDALDGALARALKQKTQLGTFLDPLADKLLLLTAFLGITFSTYFLVKPPLWVITIVVFRDFLIISGLLVIFLLTNHLPQVAPNFLGKVTTFLQMVTVVTILITSPYASIFWNLMAVCTFCSAISYLILGIQHMNSYSAHQINSKRQSKKA